MASPPVELATTTVEHAWRSAAETRQQLRDTDSWYVNALWVSAAVLVLLLHMMPTIEPREPAHAHAAPRPRLLEHKDRF